MKALLVLAALLLLAPLAIAEHHEGDAAAMPPMGKPAEMDALASAHGEWNIAVEFKMDPAVEEWTSTTGTAVIAPALSGCVNREEFSSEFMGMPFHGISFITYNRDEMRYESIWVDDMSGKIMVMHGNMVGGSLVLTGMDKRMGQEFMNRATSTEKSKDEMYFTMDMSFDGGKTWVEHMKMVYTRK
ncbi:hypothetical protein DRQ53_09750 [bacterium]|nr:MAG: hypothetical protein DRQ32_02065 [bacterium]RKZ15169.1 MAG: hypothetical protein DRQ53_09750 [bacterium]